jgi:hypothetical protein
MGQHKGFTIEGSRWYTWQMLPGYGDLPYFSPIYIYHVTPMKTGGSLMQLDFHNAGYAEGVQRFVQDLRVLRRTATHLIAGLIYGDGDDPGNGRSCVISEISLGWLRGFCPYFYTQHETELERESSLQMALSRALGVGRAY